MVKVYGVKPGTPVACVHGLSQSRGLRVMSYFAYSAAPNLDSPFPHGVLAVWLVFWAVSSLNGVLVGENDKLARGITRRPNMILELLHRIHSAHVVVVQNTCPQTGHDVGALLT